MFDISTLIRTPAYNPATGSLTKPWLNFYENIYPSANWGYGNTKAEKAYFDGAHVYTGTIVLADAAADFDLGTISGDLDDLADGSTYARVLSASLSEGLVLLSAAAGDLDDVADGTGYGKVAKTDISAGHILLSACDGSLDNIGDGSTYGKVAVTDISSGHILLASCTGDLDDIANGEGYGKVSITDISEGHILLASCDGDLDDITDGETYGKVLSAALSAGSVLLSAASGDLDDITDGEGYARVAATDISDGHILLSEVVGDMDDVSNGETYGRVAVTDISSGHILLASCSGDLDDIANGTYGKVLSTAISAGKIVVTGSAGITGTIPPSHVDASDWLNLPTDENLALDMPMNDSAGSKVVDTSDEENNGTITGATWGVGVTGQCLTFDGTGQNIALDNLLNIPNDTAWSIFYRFYHDHASNGDMTIGKTAAANSYIYHKNSGTEYQAQVRSETIQNLATIDIGPHASLRQSWHSLLLSCDGASTATVTAYVDGEYAGEAEFNGLDSSFAINSIGYPYNGLWAAWQGKLSDVKVWNGQALTASEGKALHLSVGNSNRVSGAQTPFAHSSDVTKIDGGTVYTSTLVAAAINGAGFGTLTLSSGSIVITVADGIDINAGTGLKVRSGGDIYVIGSDSDPGLIYFDGSSLDVSMGCSNDGSAFLVLPSSDGDGALSLGALDAHVPWVSGDDRRFNNIFLYADSTISLQRYQNSSLDYNSYITLDSSIIDLGAHGENYSGDNDYVNLQLDGANDRFEFYIDGSSTMLGMWNATQFYCTTNKGVDFGLAGQAWDDMYADDYNNEAELYFMDSHDDLGDICSIRGRGEFDPVTGLELIDDETLADHMIARHKKDTPVWSTDKDDTGHVKLLETHRIGEKKLSADGRPWTTNRLMFSQIHGALRQINSRLELLEV